MKQILTIFRELQNSGQRATIIGHFSIQTGNFQEVANIDDVHEKSKVAFPETDDGKNSNRYTTEHDRDDVDVCYSVSSVALLPDVLEMISAWLDLPDSVKAGIVAMVKATSSPSE